MVDTGRTPWMRFELVAPLHLELVNEFMGWMKSAMEEACVALIKD
jgi:hypothetical protein